MTKNINLQDLSISNFDQLLDVENIKGGRRSYSYPSNSFSAPSRTSRPSRYSNTTPKRRR